MDSSVETARRPTVLRRWLALAAVAIAAITATTYYLGASGGSGLSISTPPGLPFSGAIADVTNMSSTVTRTNGAAQLTTGVAIAKIVMPSGYTNKIRIEIAWTNASQAVSVLNNPNAQISIGLYHTIHTGNCNTGSGTTVDAPLVNLTDTDNTTTYCASLDQAATGSPSVSSAGKLLLSTNMIAGDLNPALDGSGSLSACPLPGTDLTDTGGWCQPASVSDSNQRALYAIASVTIPGTIPPEQQANVSSLGFYVKVRRLS